MVRINSPAETPDAAVRRGELLASLSLAIDLGLGLPMETMLKTAMVAVGLARAAGLPDAEASAAYYLGLLRYIGCTATSHHDAALLGDELAAGEIFVADADDGVAMQGVLNRSIGVGFPARTRDALIGKLGVAMASGDFAAAHRIHCEAASVLARRLGLGEIVSAAVAHIFERWDGRGSPDGVAGEALSRPMRVVHVAALAAHLAQNASPREIGAIVGRRAGRQLDPALARLFAADPAAFLGPASVPDLLAAAVSAEPDMLAPLAGAPLEEALEAVADFADFKTPHMLGHSRRVAALVSAAASSASLPAQEIAGLRHAGLVHDLGRVGVQERLWVKTGTLTIAERERIRLHSYFTERVFASSAALAPIGRLGAKHHERTDGSGYHRGLAASALDGPARLLAAANSYCALTEPRPHRPTLTPAEAAGRLAADARAGLFDKRAVDAVLTAAGRKSFAARRSPSPMLSEREIEVLLLVARQQTNRQIARALAIAPKTVERHVTHIYDKIGVTTRAGAALYATGHGLL